MIKLKPVEDYVWKSVENPLSIFMYVFSSLWLSVRWSDINFVEFSILDSFQYSDWDDFRVPLKNSLTRSIEK